MQIDVLESYLLLFLDLPFRYLEVDFDFLYLLRLLGCDRSFELEVNVSKWGFLVGQLVMLLLQQSIYEFVVGFCFEFEVPNIVENFNEAERNSRLLAD